MQEESRLHRGLRHLFTIGLTLAGIFLAVRVLPRLVMFFLPFVIGWIIAMIAAPLVRFLEKKLHIVRKHSSVAIIILVIGLIVLCGYYLCARLVVELRYFLPSLPGIFETAVLELKELGDTLGALLHRFPASLSGKLDAFLQRLPEMAGEWVGQIGKQLTDRAGDFAMSIPRGLVYVIVTVLSSYFLIAEKDRLQNRFVNALPPVIREKYDLMRGSLRRAVGGYFSAQFKMLWVIALVLLAGFLILRVPYALLLSIVVAIVDFLPVLGSGTILWPWAFVQLLSGNWFLALGLAVLYMVIQVIRQILQPKLMGDSMGLSPLCTLFFLYIGFRFYGVGGMLLAVPVGMIVVELWKFGVFAPAVTCLKEICHDIYLLCGGGADERNGGSKEEK